MSTTACAPASPDPRRILPLLAVLAGLFTAPSVGAEGIADQNAREPIEVTADELRVDQTRNLAVFRGNVEAIQGTLVLRADELRVAYDLEGQGSQTIRRIEAHGNVILTSPEETAKAEEGVYDVTAGRIVLTGDVVLTRRDNVVRGRRLVVDLRRHTATVEGGGERVRAVFRAEELRPDAAAEAGGGKEAPAGSTGGGADR